MNVMDAAPSTWGALNYEKTHTSLYFTCYISLSIGVSQLYTHSADGTVNGPEQSWHHNHAGSNFGYSYGID